MAIASAIASIALAVAYRANGPLPVDPYWGILPPASLGVTLLALEVASAVCAGACVAMQLPRRMRWRATLGTATFVAVYLVVGLLQILAWRLTHPIDAGNCC